MTPNLIYPNINFPKNKPFFYTCFVATIDGKVFVHKDGYWPLGSKKDLETYTYIRAFADVIIEGKGTALAFGKRTIDRIHNPAFIALRKSVGKPNPPRFIIMTKNPDEALKKSLANEYNFTPDLFTGSIKKLTPFLEKNNLKTIFVDGGPTLLGSFLAENMLDELFLTITPKIIGSEHGVTPTLIEGQLFKPEKIKHYNIVSATTIANEIYIHYRTDIK